MGAATRFDMASCTKVLATTSAVARLYQMGLLPLDTRVGDVLGARFDAHGKRDITVRNCLLHNAGFAPDPRPFWSTAAFGCPETAHAHPVLSMSCQHAVFESLLNQTLINPIGAKYVYSDLSFITLMYVVGHVVREHALVPPNSMHPGVCKRIGRWLRPVDLVCHFEAFVRTAVMPGLNAPQANYWPSDAADCAPTTNDTTYRHTVVQVTSRAQIRVAVHR